MLTRIRPAIRWIVVIVAAVAMVGVSYRVLVPTKGEAEPDEVFPSDHGLAELAALQLDEGSEQFYECWITWAAQNTDVLRISDNFILRPDENAGWWGMRIESSRWPTTLAVIDGSWVMRHGPPGNRGLDYIRAPCRRPGERGGPFSVFVIDRCASIRPIDPEDNFTDIDGEPIEADHAVILGVTVNSQTPIGSKVRVRFAQEPSAEFQQVRTPTVGPDKKLLTTFAIDIPGQYLMTVGGATAPNGAAGIETQNFVFEAPDEAAVCDKSTLSKTARTTTVP